MNTITITTNDDKTTSYRTTQDAPYAFQEAINKFPNAAKIKIGKLFYAKINDQWYAKTHNQQLKNGYIVVECDNTTKLYQTQQPYIYHFVLDAIEKYPTANLIRVIIDDLTYEYVKINGFWHSKLKTRNYR